jgi:hypothetical protein
MFLESSWTCNYEVPDGEYFVQRITVQRLVSSRIGSQTSEFPGTIQQRKRRRVTDDVSASATFKLEILAPLPMLNQGALRIYDEKSLVAVERAWMICS